MLKRDIYLSPLKKVAPEAFSKTENVLEDKNELKTYFCFLKIVNFCWFLVLRFSKIRTSYKHLIQVACKPCFYHYLKNEVFHYGFLQQMWPNLLKKSLMENFIFCAVYFFFQSY